MERIGILGGSFDPIHNGHLALARAAVEQLELDELLMIPAAESPGKAGKMQASGADRLAMCRLAVRDDPKITVSGIELDRGGVSYTYDTVRALAAPGKTLFLVVGSDQLPTVNRWKYGILLMECVIVAGGCRSRGERKQAEAAVDRLRACGCGVQLIDFEPITVSGTQIRAMLSEGKDPGDALCAPVREYIRTHGLYRK